MLLQCAGNPTLLGTFDLSYAPALLFYAYLPIIFSALLLAFLAWPRNDLVRSLNPATLLVYIAITYSLYLLNEIFQWITVPVALNNFSWELIILFRSILLVFITYFVYTSVLGRPITSKMNIVSALLLFPIIILLPTSLNIESFDITACEGVLGPLHQYLFFLEATGILFISYICRKEFVVSNRKIQILLVWAGAVCLMFLILALDMITEFLGYSYDINLVSPIGMLAFLGAMTYMMVKFNTFNTKIFAAQALVVILWILIGSLLLVVKSETSRIIMVLTLTLSIAFGIALVRSVRREVDARQKLAEANEGQERFIHFLSHEVKGNLTVARNGFAAIGQGDLGPVSDEVSAVSRSALERLNDGVDTVENILRSANLKSGTMTFAFAPFDLAGALRTQVEIVRPLAEKKGLALAVEIPEGEYICVGDKQNITEHVLRNLLENAIHYTERGSVQVFLARAAERFVLRVVDTGIGISQEDRMKLFTQGGRGVDSLKHNVHSTGHGLFIAKSIVEAHNGRIRAVSEGKGRGTTFEVELPMRRR